MPILHLCFIIHNDSKGRLIDESRRIKRNGDGVETGKNAMHDKVVYVWMFPGL